MTQRSGKFTRGPWGWSIQDHSMALLSGPDLLEDHVAAVGPCESCAKRVMDGEWKWGRCMTPTEANAALIAAAGTAATAAEDMGYDGQAAIEALPKLLDVLETVSPYFEGEHHYDHPDNVRIRAARAACRTKESTP